MSTDDVTTTPTPQPAADEVLAPDAQLEALRDQVAQLESRLAERTEDLQRLQAEYISYKRRVDRDRDLARRAGKEQILTDLLPALDAIQLADQHGELDGPFKMLADQISAVAARHGLSSYGQVGDQFDPTLHEALMQLPMSGATKTCISQVMQPGHRIHDKVLRPARVAVSEPDTQQAATESSTHGDEER